MEQKRNERTAFFAYTFGGDELLVDTKDVIFSPRGCGMKVATVSEKHPQKGIVYMGFKQLKKGIPSQTQDEFKARCQHLLREHKKKLAEKKLAQA